MALCLYSPLCLKTPTCMTLALNNDSKERVETQQKKPPHTIPIHKNKNLRNQITHSMPQEKIEIFKSLENWTEENILPYLKPVEKCWQPQDYLPNPSSSTFKHEIKELRERTSEIPNEYFAVLVGDMITEEALPTYQSFLNSFDGVRDETGASFSSWARWIRGWTSEENRHGDVLNKYLYLSGRVDMRAVEKTIQYLIASGMDVGSENSPYNGFIYTSFQERATFISHSNTARLAKFHGDINLAQICGIVASDEKRHEKAYTKIVKKLFEIDPNSTILALADMMKKKITMPAHLMYDGIDVNLFERFSKVAQRIGVYTTSDYVGIMEFLIEEWRVEELSGLSSEGREAQEYVCGLPLRYKKLEERSRERGKDGEYDGCSFSWIVDRKVKG